MLCLLLQFSEKEIKLKMELKREVVERKKEIYLSITNTIKKAMVPYYESKRSLTIYRLSD